MSAKLQNSKRGIHLMVERDALLVDGSDEKFRQFIYDTIAFTARMKTIIDGHASIVGLSPPQYMVLTSIMHLSRTQDVSVKTLSDHLHIAGSFVTNSVGVLVRKGLVKKVVDARDRRRAKLKETAAAKQLISRLAKVQSRVNDVMFETVTPKEFETLSSVLSNLVPSAERAVLLQASLKAEALAELKS